MTAKLKLLFDECVSSPRLARDLKAFFTDGDGNCTAEISLLQDKFKGGEDDPVWLKQLSVEGNWIVITKDKGNSTGPKLPMICQKLGITHVIISKGLEHAGYEALKQAFADVWQFLLLAPTLAGGTRISLRYTNTNPRRADLSVDGKLLRQK